jgi:hypothetical protein
MAAGNYDFEVEQGATINKQFVWKDSNGDEVDLTGYTARMQVRRSIPSDEVLFSATTENGRIDLGGAAGTITLDVSAIDSAAIVWRRGVYDLELVASNGTVTRLLQGQITVSREVTR